MQHRDRGAGVKQKIQVGNTVPHGDFGGNENPVAQDTDRSLMVLEVDGTAGNLLLLGHDLLQRSVMLRVDVFHCRSSGGLIDFDGRIEKLRRDFTLSSTNVSCPLSSRYLKISARLVAGE